MEFLKIEVLIKIINLASDMWRFSIFLEPNTTLWYKTPTRAFTVLGNYLSNVSLINT